MDNFVTDNVEQLVSVGFIMGGPSECIMNCEMAMHGSSYQLTIKPASGTSIALDDTAPRGNA